MGAQLVSLVMDKDINIDVSPTRVFISAAKWVIAVIVAAFLIWVGIQIIGVNHQAHGLHGLVKQNYTELAAYYNVVCCMAPQIQHCQPDDETYNITGMCDPDDNDTGRDP